MGSSITVNCDNFATEVLEKSHARPVLVDFFAQWCGPCKMLKPLLEKFAQEYDFTLAKVDIDENPTLAHDYGVEGVPDVRIVMDGEVKPGFVGMLSESKLHDLMAQLNLPSTLDQALETIYTEASAGNVAEAQAQLNDLLRQYPDNRGLLLEAANFCIEADDLESATTLLASIPEYEKEYFAKAKALKSFILFKQVVGEAQPDSAIAQAFQQAAAATLADDYEAALTGFLAIASRDRRYRDDGARKAMLAIFDLLGDDHPLTKEYRKQLTRALY